MRFIGITGGVGAGKSEVMSYLAALPHTRTMLADRIAEQLMEPGGVCYDAIKELFREDDVIKEDGSIDRPAMAAVLFADAKKREAVNAVVHPAVKQYVLQQLEEEKKKGELTFLFLEAALLIEQEYGEICDELWYIYTSEEVRRERLRENRGYSDEKIDRIFASQLSEEGYRSACAHEINNNGTREEMIESVQKLINSKGE